jgi:hypothetical protein
MLIVAGYVLCRNKPTMRFLNLILALFILSSCSKEEEKGRAIEINYWTTQEELNSFREELENMQVFEGDITIGHLVNDISPLYTLREITGELYVSGSEFASFELPNLERVGQLKIGGNSTLREIDMPNLKSAGEQVVRIMFNDSLQIINLPVLERYKGLNFQWNPLLNQVNLQQSIPEACQGVIVHFDYINAGSALFQNSTHFCSSVYVEVSRAERSDLSWLSNLDADSILVNTTLAGDFQVDKFCFLKEKLSQMNYPHNFKVGPPIGGYDFTGYEIIQACD